MCRHALRLPRCPAGLLDPPRHVGEEIVLESVAVDLWVAVYRDGAEGECALAVLLGTASTVPLVASTRWASVPCRLLGASTSSCEVAP